MHHKTMRFKFQFKSRFGTYHLASLFTTNIITNQNDHNYVVIVLSLRNVSMKAFYESFFISESFTHELGCKMFANIISHIL